MFLNSVLIGLCFCAFIVPFLYHANLDMTYKVIERRVELNTSTNHRNTGFKLKLNKAQYRLLKSGKEDKHWFTEEEIIKRATNCKDYFSKYLPVFSMNSKILEFEKRSSNSKVTKFAFSHMLHHQVAIYEAFLAMYFRPYNFYCIHVDLKADNIIRKALESVIKCYKNRLTTGKIVMVDKKESIEVAWGKPSVLEADLICIRKLLEFNKRDPQQAWTYTLSMAGSELPIVTYAKFQAIVSNLGQKSSLQSKRNCESSRFKGCANEQLLHLITDNQIKSCTNCLVPSNDTKDYKICHRSICKYSKDSIKAKRLKARFDQKNGKSSFAYPAWNIRDPLIFELPNPLQPNRSYTFQMFKGLKNVILHRSDADFMLNHPIGKQFHEWQKDSKIPEEYFYATLIRFRINKNNGEITQDVAPGTGTNHTNQGICARYTKWQPKIRNVNTGIVTHTHMNCNGKYINNICNFAASDLSKIDEENTNCLMGNKFNVKVDPNAIRAQFQTVYSKSINEAENKN